MRPRNSILKDLKARGLVKDSSPSRRLTKLLGDGPVTVYAGFDPTAASLHVGHLLPIVLLSRFQRWGHRPVFLVGGATGIVGDPSGRSAERNLLDNETVASNVVGIRSQLERLVHFDGQAAAVVVNNHDWIAPISHLEWLRDVGRWFSVNYMLSKKSVSKRLREREHGMSYTEFSYMLLQAYDFLHLHRTLGCMLQIGGQDQWGNITAGIDLVRKTCSTEVFGLTHPLLTTATGDKFGKSAGNAVWLDRRLTSTYQFFQFWLQIGDDDVAWYLKLFTFLDLRQIDEICRTHQDKPELRAAQRMLAMELTAWVHGEDAARRAAATSDALFGGPIDSMLDEEVDDVFRDVPTGSFSHKALGPGIGIVDVLVGVGAASSRSEARRLLAGGGVYINNRRCVEPTRLVTREDLVSDSRMVLRIGKKQFYVARFESLRDGESTARDQVPA
jgi:tyrosyl-tRNA synthetase